MQNNRQELDRFKAFGHPPLEPPPITRPERAREQLQHIEKVTINFKDQLASELMSEADTGTLIETTRGEIASLIVLADRVLELSLELKRFSVAQRYKTDRSLSQGLKKVV